MNKYVSIYHMKINNIFLLLLYLYKHFLRLIKFFGFGDNNMLFDFFFNE